MRLLTYLALAFASSLAYAQGVRVDIPPILSPKGVPVANVQVTLCAGSGTIASTTCSPQAQSFSSITLATPCPQGFPVTLSATSVCQSTSDGLGNAGFWLAPGTYIYCLTGTNINGQCYNLTVPIGATPAGTASFGSNALTAGAFVSSSPNPATTGVLRVAAGDTAVAFRNNANSGDIAALTKDTNDVVQVGGSPGMKTNTLQLLNNSGLSASCGGGALFFLNDNATPNSGDICFGDGTGWIFNFTKRAGSASTQVLQIRDTGTMMMNGGDAITANPPAPAVLSLGWKFTFWNGFAFGLGSSSIDVKTNGWMSVFAANPNNDATGAAPDSNAKVSLGSNGNVILTGNLKVGGGVTNNGSGMMHVRATSCATPAAVNGSCVGTISWPGTWADTNYTAVCTADNTGNSTAAFVVEVDSKTTTTIRVGISNAATSSTSVNVVLNCIGMHD
jgi:hypothetical protein